MSILEAKSIAERLESLDPGNMAFLSGASAEQISRFENEHGITLPSQYKDWLLFSDGGECFLPAGIQLFGVAHKPLIDINDNDRPNDNYIIIGAFSNGDPILCEKTGNQISVFDHEYHENGMNGIIHPDEQFDCFFDFMNSLYDLLEIGG